MHLLVISGITFNCGVLEDETRVISERSLANAFGGKAVALIGKERKNRKRQ